MKSESSIAEDLELIEVLKSRSLPIFCGQGRTLFVQGEACNGLYLLESGEAALVLEAPPGRAVFCASAGPGSLLGLPAVVRKKPYSMTAIVKKGSTVSFITPHDFEKLTEANPQLYPEILRLLAAEVGLARQALAAH
jgi:CRP-like cAMP-binding protein